MRDNQLQVAYDDDDTAWFVLTELDGVTGQQEAKVLLASQGFGLHHLCDALLATGSVRRDEDRLMMRSDVTAVSLREIVSEMFEYFVAPGVPSRELLDVQTTVDNFDFVRESHVRISLFAYAWLDIVVREELAEEARRTFNLWRRSHLEIDTQRICQRQLEQLVNRCRQEAALSSQSRMAPSTRQRSQTDPSAKLG